MTDQELLQIIEDAARKGVTKLDLSSKALKHLPPEIGQLTQLTSLYLNNNQLSQLPPEIGQLTKLTSLSIGDNQLSQLPPEIGQLTQLTTLYLNKNQLSQLPPEIGQLTQLTSLSLNKNQLSQLPLEISQLSQLTKLDLSRNQLKQLPLEIGQLIQLTQLDLSRNHLKQLPPEIGQLSQLTSLNLSDNQLSQLPPEIARLTQLIPLNIDKLNIDKNPLQDFPLAFRSQKEKAVISEEQKKAYLSCLRQELEVGQDTIYEAKLIIVGEGAAGKTTLVNKINNPDYPCPTTEDSTQGIDVKEYHFPWENGKDFRINIWDFGGQQLYHATHEFFLTESSLYVLVADSRKDQLQLNDWLQTVELRSKESPILIIKNERDNRPVEINEPQIKLRFPNSIEKIIPANFADNRGLDDIIRNIKHYITSLPHIGSKLPRTWTRVREVLEKDGRNYISLEEYLRICHNKGFKRQKDALQLSHFLHNIGVILHFQDDDLLKKTVILKVEWLTDAVYKFLDDTTVRKNQGRFDKAALSDIWHDKQYEDVQGELLALLMKFNLCYKIPQTEYTSNPTYIAPQLLDTNQPNYDWDDNYNLILRYAYDFMPKGIMRRFIVEMHRYIDYIDIDEPKVWRSGVILKRENTLAEVIEDYNKREIKIRLAGSNKRGFLEVIRSTIEQINDLDESLQVKKLIPCNCSVCRNKQEPYFYPFDVLQKAEDIRQTKIQCYSSFEMVDVLGLIDDIMKVAKDRNKIFISYSHQDEDWLKKLKTHLTPLIQKYNIEVWYDTQIPPGSNWKEETRKALAAAKIAVLLVSPDFLASDSIAQEQLTPLLQASKEKGLTIFWIPIRPSLYKDTKINNYQAAHEPSHPLSTLSEAEQDEAWVNICKELKKVYLS